MKCEQGRRRSMCNECGGSGIGEHGMQRSVCKECKACKASKDVVVAVFPDSCVHRRCSRFRC